MESCRRAVGFGYMLRRRQFELCAHDCSVSPQNRGGTSHWSASMAAPLPTLWKITPQGRPVSMARLRAEAR